MTDNQDRVIILIDQAGRDVDDVIACLAIARNNITRNPNSVVDVLAWARDSLASALSRVSAAIDIPENT